MVDELPGVADENTMIVGGIWPVCRPHAVAIEAIDTSGVAPSGLAARLDVDKLFWRQILGHQVLLFDLSVDHVCVA